MNSAGIASRRRNDSRKRFEMADQKRRERSVLSSAIRISAM
jgi:hypothetical protein